MNLRQKNWAEKDAFCGVSKFTVLDRYWGIIEQLQNG
jgi:hypothetical protein